MLLRPALRSELNKSPNFWGKKRFFDEFALFLDDKERKTLCARCKKLIIYLDKKNQ